MATISRREFVIMGTGAGLAAAAPRHALGHAPAVLTRQNPSRPPTLGCPGTPSRCASDPLACLGAGLYVDNAVGAAGLTGRGGANLYNLAPFLIV